MHLFELGPNQNWLLVLRRAKRSGAFLKYNIKPSELNVLIRKYKRALTEDKPVSLTLYEREILEFFPWHEAYSGSVATREELRHIPLTPYQEIILEREEGEDWRRKVLFAATVEGK